MQIFNVPLVGVFSLQILVVFAAFAAVIAVLSVQQEKEFKDALYKQLALQQGAAATDIMAPLLEREKQFDLMARMYTMHTADGGEPGTGYRYTVPSERTASFDSMRPFHCLFYTLIEQDPTVSMVLMVNQTSPFDPITHRSKWNVFVMDSTSIIYAHNEAAHACFYALLPSFGVAGSPLENPTSDGIYPACDGFAAMIGPQPIDTAELLGDDSGHETMWTRPMTFFNTITRESFHAIIYGVALNAPSPNWLKQMALITIHTGHFRPILEASAPTSESATALFVADLRVYHPNTEDMFLVTGKIGFNDTIRPPTGSNADSETNAWRGGQTPDPVLNDVYAAARRRCFSGAAASSRFTLPENPCAGAAIFDVKSGGHEYTASAVRVVYNRTKIDWLLLQYTPREEFFGASDRSRTTGIVIGVLGAVVVLVSCILIWLSISNPLRRLRANMALAAEMRNDEVELLDPVLMEMSDLVRAFGQMNTKLLRARPFLPQSLLCGEDVDTDENVESDDEGNGRSEFGASAILRGDCTTATSGFDTARATRTTADRSSHRQTAESSRYTTNAKGHGGAHIGNALVRHRDPPRRRPLR